MPQVLSWADIWSSFDEWCECQFEYPQWDEQREYLQEIISDRVGRSGRVDWAVVWEVYDKKCGSIAPQWDKQKNWIKQLVETNLFILKVV